MPTTYTYHYASQKAEVTKLVSPAPPSSSGLIPQIRAGGEGWTFFPLWGNSCMAQEIMNVIL